MLTLTTRKTHMENYKVKQNFYGLMQAYVTPILFVVIVVFFLIAYQNQRSLFTWIYLVVLLVVFGYRYLLYVERPMEIEVNGDQIKFKNIFGKITELTFADIEDIEVNRRKELFFNLKDKKIRGLNTYKNFNKFIEDAQKKNPGIKLWGFGK